MAHLSDPEAAEGQVTDTRYQVSGPAGQHQPHLGWYAADLSVTPLPITTLAAFARLPASTSTSVLTLTDAQTMVTAGDDVPQGQADQAGEEQDIQDEQAGIIHRSCEAGRYIKDMFVADGPTLRVGR